MKIDRAGKSGPFRRIFDQGPTAMVMVSKDGLIELVNDAAERLFGYRRAELVGQPVEVLVPAGVRHHHSAHRADFSKAPQARSLRVGRELFAVHQDGREFPVEIGLNPIESEEGVAVIVAISDVSIRKRMEQSLTQYAAIVESADDAIIGKSLDGIITSWNPAAEKIFGYSEAEAIGKPVTMLFPADRLPEEIDFLSRIALGEKISNYDTVRLRKDGAAIEVSVTLSPIRDHGGRIVGVSKFVHDISARKRAGAALRLSEKMLARTGAIASVGGWEIDLVDHFVTWSDELVRMHDCEPGFQPSFSQAESYLTPSSHGLLQNALRDAINLGQDFDLQLESVSAKGRNFWSRSIGKVEFENGKPVRLVGAFQDVTARRKIERELAESHELIRVTLESIGDAVITTDADGKVVWLNSVAEAMIGWSRQEARGRPLAEIFVIINPETRKPSKNPVELCLTDGAVAGLANQSILVSRHGVECGIEDKASPILNAEGCVLGAVLVFHDVSEQRRLGREMTHRATHDGLTGLVNRSEFDIRLSRLLEGKKSDLHVILYIDLDEFKVVNDSCGHGAGDLLLRQVAALLAGRVRARDTVARLGGDEFGVILERCSLVEGHRIAQKICDQIEKFHFVFEAQRFRIGASIGVVPIDQRWDNSAAALKAADGCCYAAKEAGRHRVHLWEESNSRIEARQSEVQWVNRLQSALEDDRFLLYGQCIEPIDGPMQGLHCEVLLRLGESDGAIVLPGAFLPAAERFHLACRIDLWVLRRVFAQLASVDAVMNRIEMIAINLSGQSIVDPLFQKDVIRMIGEADFDVSKLCFEITETAAITNFAEAQRFIAAVRASGVRIALDDFGAGASSFGYLRKLAVDILKIDGQFITGLLENPLDNAAVRCFCEVAKVVGAKTIAEFVERADTRKALRRIGVDMVQGFLMHRAEPLVGLMPVLH